MNIYNRHMYIRMYILVSSIALSLYIWIYIYIYICMHQNIHYIRIYLLYCCIYVAITLPISCVWFLFLPPRLAPWWQRMSTVLRAYCKFDSADSARLQARHPPKGINSKSNTIDTQYPM